MLYSTLFLLVSLAGANSAEAMDVTSGLSYEGACCQALSTVLPGKVSFSNSIAYNLSLDSYWAAQATEIRPYCIVSAKKSVDVSVAASTLTSSNIANQFRCPFAIRSGGHAIDGYSNLQSGIVIDLSAMNTVVVSADTKTTSIGPGARWEEVYWKLDEMGLSVPGGREAGVGVGGLSLAGGMAYSSPQVGFVCDNIVNYEVVLASGKIINANRIEYNDLLVSLRGGGNNFGIVTRVDIRTFAQGKMWGGAAYYNISEALPVLKAFYEFSGNPDYDPSASVIQSFGYGGTTGLVIANSYDYSKPESNASTFSEFLAIPNQLFNTLRISNLTEFTLEQAAFSPPGLRQLMATTTFKNNIQMLEKAYQLWNNSVSQVIGVPGIQFTWTHQPIPPVITSKSTDLGGNVLGLNPSEGALVNCLVTATWSNSEDDARIMQIVQKLVDDVDVESKKIGVYHPFKYIGYAASWQDPITGYGKENKKKLLEASRKYDPWGVFQKAVPGGFKLY